MTVAQASACSIETRLDARPKKERRDKSRRRRHGVSAPRVPELGRRWFQQLRHGINYAVHVFFRSPPATNAHPHGATPAPSRSAEEGFACGKNCRDHFIRAPVMILGGCAR